MADHPLLLFPTKELTTKTPRKMIPAPPHIPPHTRQCDRLSPKFNTLQRAFAAKRVALRRTMAGIDPEMALVIEIIGDVKDFVRAVKKIPGLEWLGEVEEKVLSDDDFYYPLNRSKKLDGRLYLIMTNQEALGQFLSLWEQYKCDPSLKFEHGQNRFRLLFQNLKDIRPWGVQDRINDTGVMEYWKDELQYNATRMVKFEYVLLLKSLVAMFFMNVQ
jgi:hypothetical protein